MPKGRQWSHELDVIGLKFRWKKELREKLAMTVNTRSVAGIRLEREPENEYDENAIAVYLPNRLYDGKQLGYIRRDSAALLAPKMDAGSLEVVSATLTEIRAGEPKTPWNEGNLVIRFRDV